MSESLTLSEPKTLTDAIAALQDACGNMLPYLDQVEEIRVKGKKGFGNILRLQPVFDQVLDDIGAPEIPGHPGINPYINDLTGFDDFRTAVRRQNFFNQVHTINLSLKGKKVMKSA